MTKRPRSITLIGWLFIIVNAIILIDGIVKHIGTKPGAAPHFPPDIVIHIIRALGLIGGWGVLVGSNWARWLLAIWMVFHFAIGFLHSIASTVAHAVMFSVILYFLFRSSATAFFAPKRLNESAHE
jgi:hypothetical protein